MNSATVLAGTRGIDLHDVRNPDDTGHRHDIAHEIERQLVVERRVDPVGGIDQQQRVAVRRRVHDDLGADIVAGARPVVDDELLAEPLRQILPHQAGQDVDRAAGRIARDHVHRPRRIVEGAGRAAAGARPTPSRAPRARWISSSTSWRFSQIRAKSCTVATMMDGCCVQPLRSGYAAPSPRHKAILPACDSEGPKANRRHRSSCLRGG